VATSDKARRAAAKTTRTDGNQLILWSVLGCLRQPMLGRSRRSPHPTRCPRAGDGLRACHDRGSKYWYCSEIVLRRRSGAQQIHRTFLHSARSPRYCAPHSCSQKGPDASQDVGPCVHQTVRYDWPAFVIEDAAGNGAKLIVLQGPNVVADVQNLSLTRVHVTLQFCVRESALHGSGQGPSVIPIDPKLGARLQKLVRLVVLQLVSAAAAGHCIQLRIIEHPIFELGVTKL
jgi:hypothetical protein